MNKRYLCPVCQIEMKTRVGGRLNLTGITMWCPDIRCSSNEMPTAHGKNADEAYRTIMYKWGPKDKKDGWSADVIDVETTQEPEKKEEIKNKDILSYE